MTERRPLIVKDGRIEEIPSGDSLPDAIQNIPTGGTTDQVLKKVDGTDFNLAWTDPPSDGADGANGADGADGEGVIAGGTIGQLLAKASGTDYDTEWIDAPEGVGSGVATPTIEDFVKTEAGSNATSITFTAPTGITAGELLMLIVHTGSTTGGDDWSTPSGWTKEFFYGDGTSDSTICVMWKEAAGDETDIEFTGLTGIWQHAGWYLRISGADTTNPIEVEGSTSISDDTNVVAPEITTLSDNSLVFALMAVDQQDSAPISVTSESTEFVEQDECKAGASSAGMAACFATRLLATAGDTGTCTFTHSRDDGVIAMQIAIKAGTHTVIEALQEVSVLGVNAIADTTNRLSVSSDAVLFDAETDDIQLKLNKAAAGDDASLLFQTGFSGRAEMGLAGDDDFSIKVSDDGTNWQTGMSFDGATGDATVPNDLEVNGDLTGAAVQSSASDTTAGKLMTVGAFGLGWQGSNSDNAPGNDLDALDIQGFWRYASTTTGAPSTAGMVIHFVRLPASSAGGHMQLAISNTGEMYTRRNNGSGTWGSWYEIWTTENTTVDGNGFVKEASPIVRLSDTGTDEPVKPVGAVFAKLGTGHYTLTGVEPLALSGWQIEVPQDHNGNRLVFVETDYDAAEKVLTVRTSEVAWDGMWVANAPKNIPKNRWIDLRFYEEKTE